MAILFYFFEDPSQKASESEHVKAVAKVSLSIILVSWWAFRKKTRGPVYAHYVISFVEFINEFADMSRILSFNKGWPKIRFYSS